MSTRVEAIYTYPVKGLAGELLSTAEVGAWGLPGDRRFAVPSGRYPLTSRSGWVTRRAFRNLAQDVDPAAWAGERIERGVPLWDSPHAVLSLVNLESVADLAAVVNAEVDHRRFRANLYLAGLPAWVELELVGHILRLGTTLLQIVEPIQRCRATSVDPERAIRDLPVPALLAGIYGHLHCGVYARVLTPGTVTVGDQLEDLGHGGQPTASPEWPRRVEVLARVEEARGVLSLWLRDPTGLAHRSLPGQHIRLLTRDAAGPVWRCFTVSGTEADRFRLTIRLRGRMAEPLLSSDLSITGPHGRTVLDSADAGPLVLISAGMGITPTVSILRGLTNPQRPVRVLHVDRGPRVPLWDEVERLVERSVDARADKMLTRGPGRRRPVAEDIADLVRGGTAEVFVCGPNGFASDIVEWLLAAGVDRRNLRRERFYSPGPISLTERRPPPETGPFRVRFGDDDAVWTAADGTLLDLGDGLGLDLPSGCRSGACGECEHRLVRGQVAYLTDPVVPPQEDGVLLCSAVPLSDVDVTKRVGD